MSALVEEAVTVGDLVRLFSFRGGHANLVEMTLPHDSPRVGQRVADLDLPGDFVLVAVIRGGQAGAPQPQGTVQGGDELLLVGDATHELDLARYLAPAVQRVPVQGE